MIIALKRGNITPRACLDMACISGQYKIAKYILDNYLDDFRMCATHKKGTVELPYPKRKKVMFRHGRIVFEEEHIVNNEPSFAPHIPVHPPVPPPIYANDNIMMDNPYLDNQPQVITPANRDSGLHQLKNESQDEQPTLNFDTAYEHACNSGSHNIAKLIESYGKQWKRSNVIHHKTKFYRTSSLLYLIETYGNMVEIPEDLLVEAYNSGNDQLIELLINNHYYTEDMKKKMIENFDTDEDDAKKGINKPHSHNPNVPQIVNDDEFIGGVQVNNALQNQQQTEQVNVVDPTRLIWIRK
jgi:glutaredoxin-related protein